MHQEPTNPDAGNTLNKTARANPAPAGRERIEVAQGVTGLRRLGQVGVSRGQQRGTHAFQARHHAPCV
jgi:hypothetical protein